MKKPSFQSGGLEEHHSTLDKPLSDSIKSVPKEMTVVRDGAQRRPKGHPLARYRHLRITYVTIKRPKKEADEETFLPAATESAEEEKNRILSYR